MPDYKIVLQRIKEYQKVVTPKSSKIEDSTIGTFKMFEDGKEIFSCFCCENIGPSTDASGTDKRIMPRTYYFKWYDSSKNGPLAKKYPEYNSKTPGRYKALLLFTPELPSFEGRYILIHTGNGPAHTAACLLLGLNDYKNGTIGGSVQAVYKFFKQVEKAVANGAELSKIPLEVREIEA